MGSRGLPRVGERDEESGEDLVSIVNKKWRLDVNEFAWLMSASR